MATRTKPVADPGEGPGGPGPPPYSWTKLRPEGPKKFGGESTPLPPPAPLRKALDDCLPVPPILRSGSGTVNSVCM